VSSRKHKNKPRALIGHTQSSSTFR